MADQGERRTLVIVGLGNPGKKYENTRHNIGFMVIQMLAQAKGWTLKDDSRWPGRAGKGSTTTANIHLLMPTTYMNLSGQAVQHYLAYYKINPASLLVVHDDVDLDYGTLRLRPGGGPGGHNGLKSIQAHLGISGYKRLRMGIGDREHGDLADYVLAEFTRDEQGQLGDFIQRGVAVIEELFSNELQTVMGRVNIRKKSEKLKEQSDEKSQENEHESTDKAEPL